jgi:hypothetical protein
MNFHLLIFDPDSTNVSAMKSALSDLPSITVLQVERMRYLEPPQGIDVLYLPLAASARFGSKPLIHQSLILPTTHKDQQTGLPPFVVTGTCLAADDPRGPIPEMKLLLSVVFNSIRTFNREGEQKLRRIGFWGYDLLRGLTASELKEIIIEVIPEIT